MYSNKFFSGLSYGHVALSNGHAVSPDDSSIESHNKLPTIPLSLHHNIHPYIQLHIRL